MEPPYMGVNEFLDGFTNSDNKLFYPKFIEFEYWRRRFLAWSEGDYTDDEKEYRKLWKKFYDSVAIEERKNEKCRMGQMPKRYWKNLTEMQLR
jgi:probable DNA metabolism protein